MIKHETDICIIGAGPVGLFAIFEAGMLKMRTHVVDTLDMIGGQCAALYPEKPIYDIAAHASITGQGLTDELAKQAEPFDPVYHLGQQVVKVDKQGEGFVVETSKGTQISCKGIIIAAGAGAFGPNRPPLEGLEAYEGSSVFYMVAKREEFRDKRIVIAGGGDSAVDWALSLADLAEHIYFVHRRPKFRAAPDSVEKLHALAEAGKIELVVPYQLDSLQGDNGQLTGVGVKTLAGETRMLEADTMLPFFGLSMNLGPIAEWGLNLNMSHIEVQDPTTLATNVEGIHAIGDIVTYPNKLKLIACGFSEAAMACHALYKRVHPDVALHFEYSTSKGVPA
ncbi:MAG: NAD(P)/FAD-dependent oxidoreductase [Rickettsiales bacterium]|nr:NAD(P)/FAD-dependent oxidoreductase [Rickettsiales bacterium]